MVQLRVIEGGKCRGDSCNTNIRLFRAYSTVDNYQGRDNVRFNWVHVERQRPIAPFELLICDYKSIDNRVKPYYEDYIKELFTDDEIQALQAYLMDTRGAKLSIVEETLPASEVFVPMPFSTRPLGGGKGFYDLSKDEHYSLSFRVGAYFDLRECPACIDLQQDAKELGITFIRKSLHSLGLAHDITPEQIGAIVDAIYNDMGLYVERGKPKEERIRDRNRHMLCAASPPPDSQ